MKCTINIYRIRRIRKASHRKYIRISIGCDELKNRMLYISMAFLFGILFGFYFEIPIAIIIVSMVLICCAIFMNRKRTMIAFIFILALISFVGIIEYDIVSHRVSKFEPYTGKNVEIEGILVGDVFVKEYYTESTIRIISLNDQGKTYNYSEKMLLKYRGKDKLSYGDRIILEGEIKPFETIRNPGDFNYSLYYKSRGINHQLVANKGKLLAENRNNFILMQLYKTKMRIKSIIYSSLPKEEASLLYGIITGDKNNLDEETKENYSKAGLSHILSVSGLHIGFIVLFLTGIFNLIKLKSKAQSFIIIVVISSYIMMIGGPSPAVRAFIMLLVLLLAKLYKRDYDLKSSISFACVAMLAVNPLYIHDVGFVISYACMYSIAFLYEPLYHKLKFLPRMLRGALALSLAVQLGIMPITVYYFNYVSFISVIINTIAVPISFIITIAGFTGVMIGFLFNSLAVYIFSISYYFIVLLNILIEKSAQLPFAGLPIPSLPMYIYFIYYFLLMFLIDWLDLKWYKLYKREFVTAAVSIVIIAAVFYHLPNKSLKTVFLDVGQGDSACIITPSKKAILIDGGGSTKTPEYYFNVGKKITVPALLHQGIWSLDTIIASHIHDDHIEGLLDVLKTYKVKRIIFPDTPYTSRTYEELIELCRTKRTDIIYLTRGDKIKLADDIQIDIIFPSTILVEGTSSDENNNSLVAKLSYKDFEILFTGDIQGEAEELLAKERLNCDILKVPHHGSKYSSTEDFLKSVGAKYSIISVGNNNYGHPSPDVLNRLSKDSKGIYRTDKNGAIVVITDGKKVMIRPTK